MKNQVTVKQADLPVSVRAGVFILLSFLSAAGVFAWAQQAVLTGPSRSVTESFEIKAAEHGELLNAAEQLMDVSGKDSPLERFGKILSPLSDALAFGGVLTAASTVAAHVVNIYLILSGPMGRILLSVLFLILVGLVFKDIDRLRNISMATGIAAFVFIIAIPLGVVVSGELSKVYSGGLRYSCHSRIAQFEEEFTRLEAEAASGISPEKESMFRTELTILQKGLPGLVVGASASLLLDMALLPVFLTWIFYRFGIMLANTLFGSFQIQKMGRLLKSIFNRDEH